MNAYVLDTMRMDLSDAGIGDAWDLSPAEVQDAWADQMARMESHDLENPLPDDIMLDDEDLSRRHNNARVLTTFVGSDVLYFSNLTRVHVTKRNIARYTFTLRGDCLTCANRGEVVTFTFDMVAAADSYDDSECPNCGTVPMVSFDYDEIAD